MDFCLARERERERTGEAVCVCVSFLTLIVGPIISNLEPFIV